MVIQCESCRTEFNLDESLLKEEGAKVRCSRCRHVFTAYPSAPVPAVETVEGPDIFDEPDPVVSEETDAVASEKADAAAWEKVDAAAYELEEDDGKDQKIGTGAALDSDLDVIYRDVFSEVDRGAVGEETAHDDEAEDVFREASRGEEELAESPAPVFPAMDAMDEDPPVVKKERKSADAPESAPAPKKKIFKAFQCGDDPSAFHRSGGCRGILRVASRFDSPLSAFHAERFLGKKRALPMQAPGFCSSGR